MPKAAGTHAAHVRPNDAGMGWIVAAEDGGVEGKRQCILPATGVIRMASSAGTIYGAVVFVHRIGRTARTCHNPTGARRYSWCVQKTILKVFEIEIAETRERG